MAKSAQTDGQAASKRPRSARNVISNILIVIGVALLLVAAGMWGYARWRYYKQEQNNQQLAQYAQQAGDGAPSVDWAALKAVNDEVVGWIEVPGTSVSYPVYQAGDNNKYLRQNAYGDYSIGGQVFLDYENTAPGMVDAQSVIYGHHLKDGTMFQPISAMEEQSKFDEVSTIWYVTEDATYELMPLFLYWTQETDVDVRTFDFASYDEFHTYLQDRLAGEGTRASNPNASQIISNVSHALTLVTCNYEDGYGRTILVCVPKSEAGVS